MRLIDYKKNPFQEDLFLDCQLFGRTKSGLSLCCLKLKNLIGHMV